MPVLPQLAVELDALEVAFHDEVDHPGNGIRPIGRGCPAGDHVHALDQVGRNLVQIRRRIRVGGVGIRNAQAPPVDEHQCALRPEAAQIRGRKSARRGQTTGSVVEVAEGVIKVLRQLQDDVADVGFAGYPDVLFGDDLDRAGADHVGQHNARAGDHHLLDLDLAGVRRSRWRLRLRNCSQRAECHGHQEHVQTIAETHMNFPEPTSHRAGSV